jgi:hypothetical protein
LRGAPDRPACRGKRLVEPGPQLRDLVGVLLLARGHCRELRLERVEPCEDVGQRAVRGRADRLCALLALRGVDLGREIASVSPREDGSLQRTDFGFEPPQPGLVVLRRRGSRQRGGGDPGQQQSDNGLTGGISAARHCSLVLQWVRGAILPAGGQTAAEHPPALVPRRDSLVEAASPLGCG